MNAEMIKRNSIFLVIYAGLCALLMIFLGVNILNIVSELRASELTERAAAYVKIIEETAVQDGIKITTQQVVESLANALNNISIIVMGFSLVFILLGYILFKKKKRGLSYIIAVQALFMPISIYLIFYSGYPTMFFLTVLLSVYAVFAALQLKKTDYYS